MSTFNYAWIAAVSQSLMMRMMLKMWIEGKCLKPKKELSTCILVAGPRCSHLTAASQGGGGVAKATAASRPGDRGGRQLSWTACHLPQRSPSVGRQVLLAPRWVWGEENDNKIIQETVYVRGISSRRVLRWGTVYP